MGAGCYIGPINVYDTNDAPTFTLQSIAPPGDVLELTLPENYIWVIVDDDQEEPLEFYWVIERLTIIENAEPVYVNNTSTYGSQVMLEPNSDYDGRLLSCTVRDVGGQEDTISWTLEVPE